MCQSHAEDDRRCPAHMVSSRALTRLAAELTGITAVDARTVMATLRRSNKHDPGAMETPTPQEWATALRRHALLAGDIPDETRRELILGLLRDAADEIPDGRTFHAQQALIIECERRRRRDAVRAARRANVPSPGQIARMAEDSLTHIGRYINAGMYVRVVGPSTHQDQIKVEVLRGAPGTRRNRELASGPHGRQRTSTGEWIDVPVYTITHPETGDPTAAWYAERPHHWEGGFYTEEEMASVEDDQD